MPASGLAGAQHRSIILLNSYHQGFTWTDQQVDGIFAGLKEQSPEAEVYVEYLDGKRFPGPARLQRSRETLQQYAAEHKPDILLTTDNLALDFALQERESLFPGVPIVFSGINGYRPEMIAGAARVTGVIEEIDPAGTLAVAFRLQPLAKKVLVIFDDTESGRKTQEATRAATLRFGNKKFYFLTNPTMEEVLQAVRKLSADSSFILLGNFNRDRNGAVFSHEEALARIGGESKVPIYGLWDFLFGRGIVGGSLLSGQMQGKQAATLALRYLNGEAEVPVNTTSSGRFLFDYRQMKRFGFNLALLPPTSEVINRPTTFYEDHQAVVLGSGAVFIGLGTIIILLLMSMAARKKVAMDLRKQANLLAGIITHIPHTVYWKDSFCVYQGCNENFARRAGVGNPAAIVGKTDFELSWKREEAEAYRRQDREILESGIPQIDIEQPQTRSDGGQTIMLLSKVPLRDSQGKVVGVLALSYDITERKLSEAALREKTYLLQAIIDALPAPIFYKEGNGRYLGCNQAFEKFVGLPRQQILGQTVYGIAPKELADIYFRADQELFASGGSQSYEAPIKYADGTQHEVVFHKAVFTGHDGVCAGLVGAMFDITERKSRERELEALAQLATALRTARSSEDMFRILLDCLLEVIKINGALVFTRNAAAGQAVVEVAVGICAPLAGQKLPSQLQPIRTLFDDRLPCQVEDGALNAAFVPLPGGMVHLACVPILAHDNTIGALGASRTEPFAAEDLRLLGSMAEMGANAIHRRELHERTQLQLNRLSTLQSIDRAIIGNHDFALTMEILLEQVVNQMQIDAAAILLSHSGPEFLAFGAGRGFRTSHIRETRLQPGEGIAGRAVRERQLCFVNGREELARQSSRGIMVAEEEFAFYCGVPLIARGELKGVLELFHRTPMLPDGDWLKFLEALGLQAAIALDNARLFDGLQQSNTELMRAYEHTIEGWSRALDLRDKETEGHSMRVTEMTMRLAQAMGFAEADLMHLRHGALLHDIGKMGIPDHILLKSSALTAAEWEIMKTHPKLAYQLLVPIKYLRPALEIPYAHHEKWNGSGYPLGLAGEQIPLVARLFSIVDVWDALLSDRTYRSGWSEEKVRDYLRQEAGRHFDPRLVEIFLSLVEAPQN